MLPKLPLKQNLLLAVLLRLLPEQHLLPVVLLAALGAGLGVAFAASQLRPTFGDADQLRLATGLPLLGVVTMLTSDDDRRRQRGSLFRFVAASGGLVGLFIAGIVAMTLTSRYGL